MTSPQTVTRPTWADRTVAVLTPVWGLCIVAGVLLWFTVGGAWWLLAGHVPTLVLAVALAVRSHKRQEGSL